VTAPAHVPARVAAPTAPLLEPSDRGAAPPRREHRVDRALRLAVAGGGVAFIACYLAVAFTRFRYPYQLEWLEGGVLGHVQRVLHGEPIYVEPSLRFTPYLYTPLYYYVGAAAAWVLGPQLWTLRLVSIVSSVVAFAAAARLVWLDTRNRWAALVAAGMLAASFRISGAWFDLARVDSLFLALLLVGLCCVRSASTRRVAAAAGFVLAAAFLAKQAALLPCLAVLPFLWRRGRDLAVAYLVALAGVIGAVTLWMNHATGGWYGQYTVRLAGEHRLLAGEYVRFWTQDLAQPVGVALAVGVVGLLAYRRGDAGRFWFPVTGGLLLAAWTGRLHSGGYDNVLLPAYAAVAMILGLGLHALTRPGVVQRHRAVTRAALVAVAAMLLALAYNPLRQLPTATQAANGDRLVATLARLPRPVYLPSQGWLLAEGAPGTPTTAQASAIDDVLRGHLRGSNHRLARTLRDAVAARRFATIVIDSPSVFSYLPKNLQRYYCRVENLPDRDRVDPVTGTITAPASVWMPRGPTTVCEDDGVHAHGFAW
jgi:hypothetical protein